MATSKKSPPPPRPRGRPSGQREDARPRLLDTALALFSTHGIAATSVSAIARKARVTPALLHYYFGSRQALVDAAIEERVLPLIAGLVLRLAAIDAPERAIGTFVREVVATVSTHPWLPQLWVREVLTDGGYLRERLVGRVGPTLGRRVRDIAAAAQARGHLNADLEPRLLVVSLIGLTVFALASAPIWRRVFEAEDIGPDTLTRHVLALLERGLELPHALQ